MSDKQNKVDKENVDKELDRVRKILEAENARGSILLAAALLEEQLKKQINKKLFCQIFKNKPGKYERSLSSIIDDCKNLGILTKDEYETYMKLKTLRNMCAHVVFDKKKGEDYTKEFLFDSYRRYENLFNAGFGCSNLDEFKKIIHKNEFMIQSSFIYYISFVIAVATIRVDEIEQIKPMFENCWDVQ